jgi:GNAT superfamily N-acetyltransferase
MTRHHAHPTQRARPTEPPSRRAALARPLHHSDVPLARAFRFAGHRDVLPEAERPSGRVPRDDCVVIRRLEPDEVELLKELRLSALADAPTAYASTYEKEAAYSDDEWRFLLRADGHPTFVWEAAQGAEGMVVGVHDDDDPEVMHLYAMWVRPSSRGNGSADALVARVVTWAGECSAKKVRLHVTVGNHRAERLYARHGFVPTGRSQVRERDGLTEIEMEFRS